MSDKVLSPRYGLYFVPDDASALGQFGAALFGRWPGGSAHDPEPSTEADGSTHPERASRTARAARYGFHATLKAPMMLVDGATESDLVAATRDLARALEPSPRVQLALRCHNDVHALVLDERAERSAIDRIAERCVLDLEPLRAPLSIEARARRRPDALDPAARARLDRYGYPWVLDGFEFHMTLAQARLADGDDAGFTVWLRAQAAAALDDAMSLDRLALCRESAPGAPFRRIAEFAL